MNIVQSEEMKYRIQHVMAEKFTKKMYDETKNEIMRLLSWSDSTWRRNVRARKGTPVEITATDMRSIANVIGCPMDELFND